MARTVLYGYGSYKFPKIKITHYTKDINKYYALVETNYKIWSTWEIIKNEIRNCGDTRNKEEAIRKFNTSI